MNHPPPSPGSRRVPPFRSWLAVIVAIASGYAGHAFGELRVSAPRSLDELAMRIAKVSDQDLEFLEELTGARLEPPISVALLEESSSIAQTTPEYIAGFAQGDSVTLFPARARSYPNSGIDELLRHELTHVLIFRASRGREVPRWFHEGLATLSASEWGLEDRAILTLGVIADSRRSLDEVEEGFVSGDAATIRRSYALSFAFVRQLVLDHGRGAPSRILEGLAEGRSFREAWVSATGETLLVSERRFWSERAVWNQWIPIVTSSIFLWILVTLFAMWAIRVRRRRDQNVIERWEDEEDAALRSLLRRLPPEHDDDELVN